MKAPSIIYERARLEERIRELGGKVPAPWPWADTDPVIRNLQLLEFIEALERGGPLPKDMTGINKLMGTNKGWSE